jgi:hypothetical protein
MSERKASQVDRMRGIVGDYQLKRFHSGFALTLFEALRNLLP